MSQRETKLVRNSLNDIAPNNSNKVVSGKGAQAPQGQKDSAKKKLKPVVAKANVIKKKKTIVDKFKESFLGESENLGDYVLYDVLIPAFRDTISDMGFGLIERTFGGGRSRYGRSSNIVRDRGRSYVSYNGAQNDNRRDSRRDLDRDSRARHDFDNITFTNKWEAEEVLSNLVDLIAEYSEATVRQFYELSNMDADYTDDAYGWTNLRDAYVERTRKGYVIMFPRTIKL